MSQAIMIIAVIFLNLMLAVGLPAVLLLWMTKDHRK